MPRKKVKKKVTKVRLADLLGAKGEANADLYKKEPKRRKQHLRHRTPRNRLITPKGSEYTRPLAGDAVKDIKINELAREFVNNGLKKTTAVAAVFGVNLTAAKTPEYMAIFDSSHFRSKVALMLQGVDGKFAEPTKEYAIQRVMHILEMNILDYVDDDGRWLTVKELKALPREMQVMLDDFTMTNTIRHVGLRDAAGEVIKGDDGNPHMIEVREQVVRLKLPDKTANLKLLGEFMKWLDTHGDNIFISGDIMMQAESRLKELQRNDNDIEGTAKRLPPD